MQTSAYWAVVFLVGVSLSTHSEVQRVSDTASNSPEADVSPSHPITAMDYVTRGVAHCHSQEWERAISDFDQAIHLNPTNAAGYDWRGCAYLATSNLDKAIGDFSWAIQLDPENARAYCNRANAYRAKQEFGKALEDINQCLRLSPTNQTALKSRVSICKALGRFHDAIVACSALLRSDPDDAEVLLLRGYCYRMNNQPDKAIQDYNHAIRLDPLNPEGFNELGWLRAACAVASFRDGKAAVEAATKACELSQWKAWQYLDTLAAAYAEAGDFANAIKHQRDAMKMEQVKATDREQMLQRLSLYERQQPYRETAPPTSGTSTNKGGTGGNKDSKGRL